MEVFHLLIKEGITELFYYFSTSSKLTDLGKDQQWLATSLKERKKKLFTLQYLWGILLKKLNLNLLIPLHLNNIRQRIYGAEEHVKWHHGYTINRLQTAKTIQKKPLLSSIKKLKGKYWEIYRCKGTYIGTHRPNLNYDLSRQIVKETKTKIANEENLNTV